MIKLVTPLGILREIRKLDEKEVRRTNKEQMKTLRKEKYTKKQWNRKTNKRQQQTKLTIQQEEIYPKNIGERETQ